MAALVSTPVICHTKPFDRFIPFRPMLDVDAAYVRIRNSWANSGNDEPAQYISSNTRLYWKLLDESVGHRQNGKILPIGGSKTCVKCRGSPRPKAEFTGFSKPYEVIRSPSPKRRRVPTSPERIMDMPGLQDDYYTNILDWSKSNMLAVALHQNTYVWFVDTAGYKVVELRSVRPEQYYISALCWSADEPFLAIADTEGEITVCNIERSDTYAIVYAKPKQGSAVGVMQWTAEYGIISGNAKGVITVSDPRVKTESNAIRLKSGKTCEIIGLRQAPGSSYLASGGEGGGVDIWDLRAAAVCTSIKAHGACAKALSWCPYKSEVLATGGGSTDGHIRLWQVHTGKKLGEVFTQSQICGLLWSKDYCELVSAHGSVEPEKNDLVLWNMRNMEFEAVSVLRQHLARPLHIALSPDETTIASVGADEALCLWNAFPKKCQRPVWSNSVLDLYKAIR